MIKDILKLLPTLKKALKFIILGALVLELLKLVPNIIFKELIDSLIIFDESKIGYIITLIAVSFVVSLIVSFIEKISRRYNIGTIIKCDRDLISQIHQQMMDLSLGYHERQNTGRQVSKITKGLHQLFVLLWHMIFDFIPVCFQVMYSTILIFIVSWKIGLVFIGFMPIFLIYTSIITKKILPLRDLHSEYFEKASGKLGEMIINIKTVKDFNQEKAERKIFSDYYDLNHKYWMEREDYEEQHYFIRDAVMQVGRILTLAVSIYLVYIGEITAGSLVLIVTLNEKAFASIFRIGRTMKRVNDSISGVERLTKLLDEEITIRDKAGAKKTKRLSGAIEFRKVNFGYDFGDEVLHDISFKVKQKQVIAFIGSSGSGKSTIIKLIYRHFDIDSGKILLDDEDIMNYKMRSIRKHLAIVSQDIELFNDTILKNITYGVESFEMDDVIDAAKMANAHQFISKFKKGYMTIVGEKGVKLSGGQKQRIGIVRALLRKPAIMIFDEATSSLDTRSEKLIQDSIKKILKKQTMIIIAHRLSTIEHADKVIVLENGRIVEQGNPKELMSKKGGLFRKMRELQRLGTIR